MCVRIVFLSLPSCISQPWQAACAKPEAVADPYGRAGIRSPRRWSSPRGDRPQPPALCLLAGCSGEQQPLLPPPLPLVPVTATPPKDSRWGQEPFPTLQLLFMGWSLLPKGDEDEGNTQSCLGNWCHQENTLEKLKLSIYCTPYTSFLLNVHGARQNTSDWFIPDPNT